VLIFRETAMALDEAMRMVKERVFLPLARAVASTGVTPTQLTLIGFAFGLGACGAAAAGLWVLASSLWWAGRIMDGLDGTLARFTKQQSDYGGYVDILCDFTVYSLLPVAVVWRNHGEGGSAWLVLSLLLGSYFVNAAGLFMLSSILEKRSQQKQLTSVAMPRGLIEGVETMVFYQMYLLFPNWCELLMSVFCAGVVVTILLRLHWAANNL
jgi:phosphatidylglycerophosphate synthase